ncbi:MUP3 [[Candida] subhashii]|uniref:MUP3 n=1 Tax=[Candida] subhashii TaxID=561895 RepID=A0A8J5UJY6_9ASCO|nr:MUP3 [[Candida] subhashii]KAG7664938.1 MUP3 [[Candida] subhashii]
MINEPHISSPTLDSPITAVPSSSSLDDPAKRQTEDIEMENIDKSEYVKISDTATTVSIIDDSSSSITFEPTSKISHLQDLEDLPQGRHLGLFSTIILFVSRILGSGIFSITSGIYEDCGRSVFLFFLAWFVACVASFGGLYVFLEMGSLVPRSGGAKVFLEFIYTTPELLATVAFSVYSVMFGFTISNVLVFGEYCIHAVGITPTDFNTRTTGLLFLYLAAGIHGVSVNHGVRVQNILGALKLVLVGIMVATGIYVAVFPSSMTGLENQIDTSKLFAIKTQASVSTFASAVIKASFAFSGWNSVHTVSNEIKDPVRTFKIAGPVSLGIMAVTYFITNLAYLIVIPEEELVNSHTLVGAILFEKIFGKAIGQQLLTFSVALCAGGNIFVVIYTISRVSQEVFREGYLPFSKFMSSNWPFGAPLRTLLLSISITTSILVLFPHGDVYNYMVALEGYPQQLAIALIAIGIFIVRKRHPDLRAPIRAGVVGTVLVFLVSLYLIIGPFISKHSPNPKGLENWPSYGVVGTICILACISFWYFKFRFFPWIGKYELIAEEHQLSDGLMIKKWNKVYNYSQL